jgi:predicted phosphodiesterase
MPALLHLSDIHFSEKPNRFRFESPSRLANIVAEAVAAENIDYLVLSGDFTWEAQPTEFNLAAEFVGNLRDLLKVSRERLVLIPGNHDVVWPPGTRKLSYVQRFAPYEGFYRGAKGVPVTPDLSDFVVTPEICILGLNSSSVEGKDFPGYGLVGDTQWDTLWKLVQKSPDFNESATRVAVLHHHLLPVTWLEPQKKGGHYSLTLDSERLQNKLMSNGFRLVLHGHQHQPFARIVSNPISPVKQSLLVSAAGSVGVEPEHLGNIQRNHFQVVQLRSAGNMELKWFELDFNDPTKFTYEPSKSYFFPEPTRQHAFRIGVSGCSSHELQDFCDKLKSTLAKHFAGKMPVSLIPSPAKELIPKGATHDADTRTDDYPAYLYRHLHNVNQVPDGVVIFNRTLLDTLAFAEVNENLPGDWLLLAQEAAVSSALQMDAYFYIPLQNTAEIPSEKIDYYNKLDTRMRTVLDKFCLEYTTLEGTVEQRVSRARELIRAKLLRSR